MKLRKRLQRRFFGTKKSQHYSEVKHLVKTHPSSLGIAFLLGWDDNPNQVYL